MDTKRDETDIDQWLSQLYECKPLNENQVKLLCDKVSTNFINVITPLENISLLFTASSGPDSAQ